MRVRLAAAAALVATSAAAAQPPPALRFVTCPIYRDADAGRKSGCWLAEDRATGKRYDVSLAPAKPDWNREVLVEGRPDPTAKTGACGGEVLDPVRTSVLPGECTRRVLPAEDFTGRKFVLPKRNVQPMAVVRDPPQGPFTTRSFVLFYSFDSDFLTYQYDDFLLDQAITWLRAAKPAAITVTGYAATTPATVSGETIAEDPAIARARAEKIAEALVRLGIDRRILTVRWKTGAQPLDVPDADGLAEPSRRRVEIAASFR